MFYLLKIFIVGVITIQVGKRDKLQFLGWVWGLPYVYLQVNPTKCLFELHIEVLKDKLHTLRFLLVDFFSHRGYRIQNTNECLNIMKSH